MSAVAVRFAPSPTGRLHVGNARGALLNWLFARKAGGSFLLRLDDTDTGRSTEEFARGIEDDLRWLGLDWDRFAKQSDRFALYAEAAEKLRKSGRLYPAYETPEELELRRKIQLSQRRPPVYDRAALKLTDADRAKLEAEGRRPVWRFKLEHNRTAWDDLIHGHVEIDMASLSDPVLLRSDGYPLYTLSSVVDDGDLGITHVIRGEDHVTNTAAQIQLFEALGYAVPTFGHFSLLLDAEGGGLSKRLGSLSLADLRAQGIEPMALNSLLARLGSADPVEPKQSLQELVAGFDLTRFSRAPARLDPHELETLNARILHELPFATVRDRLPAGAGEDFWLAVRGNLATVGDAADWWTVVQGDITPVIEDEKVVQAAIETLPPEPWDATTWKGWSQAVAAKAGVKGRALFHPLRLALTGRDKGPEMAPLLPLIGRERALKRLRGV
ncbi:MAG TPA: glutamate--tRNA ligase [Ferrovibrio sp.]|uniref:glutamate--tRNA ligase n=1 Tax=Ferrovibrio sp. TaxID=1917215 RepID=UPI002B4B4DFD|nr:glutamate--tRNA ligase [Ferrovibrio sp.]HLT78665.1 glutamate--tRNA ligase [Ferrovibrio sp.]